MKIKFTLLLVTLCLMANAQINMEDSTVQVITYWDMNESYTYEITQKTIDKKHGQITKSDSISYKVKVTVIDSTATSYTVKWEFLDGYMQNIDKSPKLKSLINERKYIYTTNELGEFQELLNWEDVGENLFTSTMEGYNALMGDKVSAEDREKFDKTFRPTLELMKTKDYAAGKGIEYVSLFHTFMGAKYKLGELVENEVKIPNEISPDNPLIAQATVRLDKIIDEGLYYVLLYEQAVDKEQLTAYMKQIMALVVENLGMETNTDEVFENADLVHSRKIGAAINNWGWILYLESIVDVNLADTQKTVKITIQSI